MNILLLGLGKTGTTALLYGIKQQLVDYETLFEPKNLKNIDYSKGNLIVKSLGINKWRQQIDYFDKFNKKILIIRHPFDRLISYLLYMPYATAGFLQDKNVEQYLSLIKKKVEKPDYINTLEIVELFESITNRRMLDEIVKEHRNLLEIYETLGKEFCVLKYEDFIDRKLNDLEEYLNIKLSNNIEVEKKYKRVERSKNYGEWKNWFTIQDIEKFSPLFSSFNSCFQYDYGYQIEYKKQIKHDTSYLYTLNVINQFRSGFCLPDYEYGKIKIAEEGLWIDKAIYSLKNNDLTQAEKEIIRAIDISPNLPGSYLVLGRILAKNNKFKDAELAFDNALKTFSESLAKIKQEQKKISKTKSKI